MQILAQFGNALSIGFSLELESLASEKGFDLFVVGDDAIVNDGEFPVGVRSRFREG